MLAEGFTQVPNHLLKNPAISFGAKVTYAMLLQYAWANEQCFPGQDCIARDMGCTRPRVTQFMAELTKHGLLSAARRGQGKTNVYTVHCRVKVGRVVDKREGRTARGKPVYLKR